MLVQQITEVLRNKKMSARTIRKKLKTPVKMRRLIRALHHNFKQVPPAEVGSGKVSVLVFELRE